MIVSVSWIPPYSLANVLINYELILSGTHSNTLISHSTTDTNYTIVLSNLCDDYVLTVIPVNGAGNGEKTNTTLYELEGKHGVCMCIYLCLYVCV